MSEDVADPPTSSANRPTPPPARATDIFLGFASVSVIAFGGVLPWARRMVVEQRRWMSAEEFNEAFALCQFLPGPNIVNFAVVFGSRCGGGRGALAALAGILGPPVAFALVLAALYARFGEVAALQRIFAGLAAAAAGLIIAVSAKMAAPVLRRSGPAALIALCVFAAVGLIRWPLIWVLVAATPSSIVLTWWWRR